jgi:AraC-like DNA-binding protein
VLQAEVESEDVASRLYAEVLANALAVHFLSRYAGSRQTVRESTGGLSLYKLRRTTEYINEHVERDLSLTELAAVAHMSLAHFARLFRQATGLTPHQYVIVCRIEHAKRFLAETELPIIDFRHHLIKVEAAYTKTREARSVPMSETLTATLKQLKINAATDPTESVFGYRQMTKTFARTVQRAGIANFTFHNLRHTFASRLVMAGIDLATVKELMGHKHITMTLRYAHLAPGHKRSAIAALDRVAEKVPAIFTTASKFPARHHLQAIEK